jgi:hypothetical protein
MKKAFLVVVLVVCWCPAAVAAETTFAGTWETTFGTLTLTQDGKQVKGTYTFDGKESSLEGQVEKGRLTFRYKEPDAQGEGWFELAADGQSFRGKWRADGDTDWSPWEGKRTDAVVRPLRKFDGVWETRFGRMRLVEDGDAVQGVYAYGGNSTLSGKVEGNRFTFRYQEPDAEGEGQFDLAADGNRFDGRWRPKGTMAWSDWSGTRVQPVPGRVWLVVVEANWEKDLADHEYSFGSMLRAFFARSPNVQVRHRLFQDERGLKRWCGELAYLAEPAVLVLASHGDGRGLTVDGHTVGAAAIADSVRYARSLRLLHFSACLAMKDALVPDMVRALGKQATFPISGYTTSVDWASSAIIEFAYFDMVLCRGMSPTRAAEQVRILMPFSGDKQVPGAALPAAGFRLLVPDGGH